MISDSVFGHHVVRQQLLVPCFCFSRTRWFSSSLFVRIPFLCHLLCWFYIFVLFVFVGFIACQTSSHDVFLPTDLNNNYNSLYQCLKVYIHTKWFFYSWRHLLTKCIAHPAAFFWVSLFMFNNRIFSLQKASKQQIRWSYKMSWPLKTPTKSTLQNVQFCLLGSLLQNALVRGLIVTTKWLYISYL